MKTLVVLVRACARAIRKLVDDDSPSASEKPPIRWIGDPKDIYLA